VINLGRVRIKRQINLFKIHELHIRYSKQKLIKFREKMDESTILFGYFITLILGALKNREYSHLYNDSTLHWKER
jgi:hypothetical protein